MIRVTHAPPELAIAGATEADRGEDSVPIPVIKNGFSCPHPRS